ncbi:MULTISPECIES: Rqc2 family fibronectin-binding protein [Aphanothece]|uniref:Rqc2 family fibronectin-binding protein n=1 Tax=Aphanothece TaxID=1121 RepID=UPI003984C14D
MTSLQPLDVTSLKAVLSEWRPLLLPSRMEKAQQAGPCSVQLGLRHLQGMQWIELSWQAEAARLHAIPAPPRQGDGSTLAQQLQHGLGGLALVSLEQPGWERVVELGFARRPGELPQRWLVVELMGRHSNLLLLEPGPRDGRQVVALGRQVRPSQSRLRPIGTGDPYQPPPPLPGDPPRREEPFESWRRRVALLPLPLERALREAYQGISPALARELAPESWLRAPVTDLSAAQWQELWSRWQGWLEAVAEERFAWQARNGGYCCWLADGRAAGPGSPPPRPDRGAAMPLNTALATYYGDHLASQTLQRQRQQLRHQLELLRERESRQAEQQQALLDAVPESVSLQQRADGLLSQPQPGRACIDEAQKLYRLARKRRRSVEAITPRLERHRLRLAWIDSSLTFLEQADSLEEVTALRQEVTDQMGQGSPASRRQRRASGTEPRGQPQPLELRSPGGLGLQVGRNHRQNDWIAFRQARRGDLWFHAQELPGSHVVLRCAEAAADEADLQAAADLAAHFSRGRGNRRVPVVMVPAEQLQRIPGGAPGTVRHRGGELFWGEPERALSLLAARQP